MYNNLTWSEIEKNIIRTYYPEGGYIKCKQYLNRTEKAIRKQANTLNVRRDYKGKYDKIFTKDNLSKFVLESFSYLELARKLNISRCNVYFTVKKYIKKYNIDTSHFVPRGNNLKNKAKPLSEILIQNSNFSRTHLKHRLYNDGLKERKCEKCGQGEIWNGDKMSLILDHKNGVRDDNRIENLRILCANCNATLPTHCGKNVKLIHKCIGCGIKISHNSKRCMKCYHESTINEERIVMVQQIIDNKTINFTKRGWVGEIAKLIGLHPQKVNVFFKKYFFTFYKNNCKQRPLNVGIMQKYKDKVEINKNSKIQKIENRKMIILNSDINFHERGALTKLAMLLCINKVVCLRWINRHMPNLLKKTATIIS